MQLSKYWSEKKIAAELLISKTLNQKIWDEN